MTSQTILSKPTAIKAQGLLEAEHREELVRRAAKVRFAGQAHYWQAPDVNGTAMACNLGGGEILLRLDRFLVPGDNVYLKLDCLRYHGAPIELKAHVCWCRAAAGDGCLIAVIKLVKDYGPKHGVDQVAFDSLTVSSSATASEIE